MKPIIFEDKFPEEIKPALVELLTELQWLLPDWLHELHVFWTESDSSYASYTSSYKYRRGFLYIHPNFLTDPSGRLRNLLHEIGGHGVNSPLQDWVLAAIDRIVKDELTREILKWEVRERVESTASDWENLLMAKIYPEKA